MNRRAFLAVAFAGCAALARGGRAAVPGEGARTALERARRDGKPLLAVLVQDGAPERERLGVALAGWLKRSRRDVSLFADLACVHAACIRPADLEAAGAPVEGDAAAALAWVETDRMAPAARALATPIPAPGAEASADWSGPVREALGSSPAARRRRAAQAEASLGGSERSQVGRALRRPQRLAGELAFRAAACFRDRIRSDPAAVLALESLLAKEARGRLLRDAPAGARWSVPESVFCNAYCSRGPCGSAHVADHAAAFLSFYVDAERDA